MVDSENPSNPHAADCPYVERITRTETDVKWLKKLITPSIIMQAGTFLTVIVLVLKLVMGGGL